MSNEQTIIVPQVAPITSEDNAYFIDAVFFPRPPEHIPEKDRMFLPSREELSRLACMAPGHPITTDHSEWINYVHPNGVMSCHCTKPAMRIGQIVSAHIDEQGRMCGTARLDPTTLGFMEAAKIHGGEKPDVSIGVYATRQVVDGKAVVTFSLDHVALVRTGKGFGTHIVSGHSKIRPDLTFTGRKFGMKDDDNKFMQFIAEQRQRRQQQTHSGTSGNQVCAFSQNAKTIAQSTQMNSCAVVLYAIGARVDVVHCQFGLSNTNGSSSMSSSETTNTSAPTAPASTPATNTTAPVATPATAAPTPNEAPRELDGTDAPDTLDHVKQLEELIASSGDQFVQRDAKFLEVVKAQNLKNTTLEERNIILEQQLKDALAQLETANNLYGDHTMKQANEIIGVLRQVVEDPNSRPILEQNGLGPNDIEALSSDFKSMDPQTRERFYKLSRTMAAFSQKEVISTQSAPAPSAANAEAERLRQSNLQLLQSIVNTAPKTPATGGSLALKTPFASILTGQAPLSLNRGSSSSSSSSSSCAGASMPQPAQSPMQSQSVAAYGMGGSVRQQTFDPSTQNAANEKMLGRRGAPDNDTANPAKQPAYVDLSQMWSTCVFPSAGPPM